MEREEDNCIWHVPDVRLSHHHERATNQGPPLARQKTQARAVCLGIFTTGWTRVMIYLWIAFHIALLILYGCIIAHRHRRERRARAKARTLIVSWPHERNHP